MLKVGTYKNYLSIDNKVERGKVQVISKNKVKFNNANYLVTFERVFASQKEAEKYKLAIQAGRRKNWRISNEE